MAGGVYLSVTALFEEHGTALSVMLGATAAMLLIVEYLLIANMSETKGSE